MLRLFRYLEMVAVVGGLLVFALAVCLLWRDDEASEQSAGSLLNGM